MEATIRLMTRAIAGILEGCDPSIYLLGSCTLQDFRPGWSDIDLLVLTRKAFTQEQAERLLHLRDSLPLSHPDACCARACEGGILPLDILTNGYPGILVYWGTSGERLTDAYRFDSFSRWLLHRHGQLLYGADVRCNIPIPTPSELHADVAQHLRTILDHGHGSVSLYTFGWLLDIARGLYTLQHDAVIAKTAAGEWALAERLCPDEDALTLALAVRRDPSRMQEEAVRARAAALTPAIRSFAAVLQQALTYRGIPIPD